MKAIEIINLIMIFFAAMALMHIIMIVLGKWKLSLGYKVQVALKKVKWEHMDSALHAEIEAVNDSVASYVGKVMPDGIRISLIYMTNNHIDKYADMLAISTKSDEVISLKEKHDQLAAVRKTLLTV